ncbi:unnamed protein product [Aphanomyces euteiches]
MAPGRPTLRRSGRGESTRSAAKAAALKINASQTGRQPRMKRVVYDESDVSSEQDDKRSASNADDSEDDEANDDEEKSEDANEAAEESESEKPTENEAKVKGASAEEKEEEEKEDAEDSEHVEEDDEEDEEDIRQLIENTQDDESLKRLIDGTLGQMAHEGQSPTRDMALAFIASVKTVENLLNMKFKSVSFPQLKTEVFTLLVRQRPEYINIAIKVILQKERLAATLKDVDNLKMMPLIFRETTSPVKDLEDKDDSVFKRMSQQHPGFETSKALGAVLQEMAMISSNLPTLKNTLRKVIRSLGQDQLDLRGLCQGLMVIPKTQQSLDFFVMMGELVALSLFVQGAAVRSFQVNFQEPVVTSRSNLLPKAIDKGPRRLNNQNLLNPTWNPSANASGDASQKRLAKEVKEKAVVTPAIKAREELTQLIAEVQRMAINWCHELQQLGEQLGMRLFGAVIRKIMFIDMLADMQPTDHDRGCFNFCKDMLPLHETTIVGIVEMCYYASPEETLEILKILETVVIRAGEGHIIRETYFETQEQIQEYQNNGGLMGLRLDRLDFSLHLLEAGVVRGHSYDGKSVCYAELYWLSCCVLLILVSFNPSTLGASVWESIPTMRSLMQMAITGRYTFPPVGPEDAKLFELKAIEY